MTTPHKHAEAMAQYAQDAAATNEPWKLWQYNSLTHGWQDLEEHPVWLICNEYRRKPQEPVIRTFHGVALQMPLEKEPAVGTIYWAIDVLCGEAIPITYKADVIDYWYFENGMAYATQADAEATLATLWEATGCVYSGGFSKAPCTCPNCEKEETKSIEEHFCELDKMIQQVMDKMNAEQKLKTTRAHEQMITVNGYPVPKPMTKLPDDGMEYYIPDLVSIDVITAVWNSHPYDFSRFNAGYVHKTKEAARVHLNALISASKV